MNVYNQALSLHGKVEFRRSIPSSKTDAASSRPNTSSSSGTIALRRSLWDDCSGMMGDGCSGTGDGRFEMVALGRLFWDDTWKTHTYERYEVNGVYSVECTRWSVLGGVYSVECTRWSLHDEDYI